MMGKHDADGSSGADLLLSEKKFRGNLFIGI
jgi:hypothetical protein